MNNYLIIIPTFNRIACLTKCLDSILNSISLCDGHFTINVIVNDSNEYKQSILKNNSLLNLYENVNFIRGKVNYFWSQSIRLGYNLRDNNSHFAGIFLINDDTLVDATTFREFLIMNFDKIKVCRVYSLVQRGVIDYQLFEVLVLKFSIQSITNYSDLQKANSVACRFSYFPAGAFDNLFWKFSIFIPQYLGDIYISYSAYCRGYAIEFIQSTHVHSMDRIIEFTPKYNNFFKRHFSKRSSEYILSFILFWIMILTFKSRYRLDRNRSKCLNYFYRKS
jgi:hypothetical protein